MKRPCTALITGASGGLGLEFARICARKGCDLVLVARNKEKLLSIGKDLEDAYGIRAWACPSDLSVKDAALELYAFTEERGLSVDVLINNAGFGDAGPFMDRPWQKQYEMVQVNIASLMQLTHLYLKPMTERGYGKVLNLSSVAAFCAGPDMSVYYASKAFVMSFSEALAEEVKGTGVTVTALCPGPTATGFEKAVDMGKDSRMFKRAASPSKVAEDGIRAMEKGRVLVYEGAFTKLASVGSRIAPRFLTRRLARSMNR